MEQATKTRRADWKTPVTSVKQAVQEILQHKENDGTLGRIYEVSFRAWYLGVIERTHPQGVSDAVVKSGVALEIGHACKALTAPCFDSAESAMAYWNGNKYPMTKCTHIAYSMTGTIDKTFSDTRIYSQRAFINILESCGLVRAKENKKGSGKWKVSIQTFKFKDSHKKENLFREMLENAGETPQDFMARMFK